MGLVREGLAHVAVDGCPAALHHMKRSGRGVAVILAGGMFLAACASAPPPGAPAAPPAKAGSLATQASRVKATVVANSSKYGEILTTASGYTVYGLTADTPTTTACTGGCLSIWPPLTVTGTPVPGRNVVATLLGTILLSDGQRQVTYNGHPLYIYSGDHSPGATNGEGISFPAGANPPKGHWYVVASTGDLVTSTPTISPSTTTAGGY
ncbi:MAG: COG4315 family predicted lipoprotein [Acidimicrobiales bacterium]